MERESGIYLQIWEDRKKKIWSEELREKYKEVFLVPKPVETRKFNYECTCIICGSQFSAGSSTATLCSDECRYIRIEQIKDEKRRAYAKKKNISN